MNTVLVSWAVWAHGLPTRLDVAGSVIQTEDVELFRFDEEISTPGSDFGSRFRVGPVTGGAAQVRVRVMHLPADGPVGRHTTSAQQLFAVVAGRGWASGQDGQRREISSGYAALWANGEDHEAYSAQGARSAAPPGRGRLTPQRR